MGVSPVVWVKALHGCSAAFGGTDADHILKGSDKNLAVTDLATFGCMTNSVEHALYLGVIHGNLDLYLGQKIDHVFGTTIEFGMPLLAAHAFHFSDGDALNTAVSQRLANGVELERFDDGGDELHRVPLS